ncbi:MAG: tetratricopeptide repeat protein [Acidobacteria bacterium]|nr:tetratricopeptide repeat protein [Acidobacteriota bacterium]
MFQYLLLAIVITFCHAQQASDPAAQFQAAVALQQQGQLDEAAAAYRALLKRKPDYAEAHANLGVVLARLGQYQEAIHAYEAAYKLAPQLTPILLNLGIAHYRAGQFAAACAVLPKFLEKQPNSWQARQLYGLSLAALGREEEALTQLEPTLDAAPPDAAVLYTAGLAYLRLGRAGFRATLERLAAFPAGAPALHLLQGHAFLRDQEFEQALEELRAAEKLNPELPRLYYALGTAHAQLAQHREAAAAFENQLRRTPEDATTMYALAVALEAVGNLSAAQQYVTAALKLDPQNAAANGLLGKILFKQGKAAEAVKLVELGVKGRPTDQELRYQLARIYQQLGRKEDAAREFAAVQKLKAEQLKQDRANTPKP